MEGIVSGFLSAEFRRGLHLQIPLMDLARPVEGIQKESKKRLTDVLYVGRWRRFSVRREFRQGIEVW